MLKFAIIGCGRISRWHVEAVVFNGTEAELVAVCDINREKAQEKAYLYAQAIGRLPLVYTDYRTMLEEVYVDVVTIATESGYHASIATECMKKGRHVLVEKPMALSSKDADNMIRTSRNMGVKLGVCHQNRFNPSIIRLRRALEAGCFGRLINGTASIRWNRGDEYYSKASWRGTWSMDGGTLMNQCIHDIDLLQWMLGGQIETVYAQTGTFLRNIEGEDFGAVIIRFKNKAIGIVEGSACVYPSNLCECLSIFGEDGTAVIGGLAVNKVETWMFKDNTKAGYAEKTVDTPITSVYGKGHQLLFKDMIDAISNNREPLINGEEGRKALDIVLAAYKSSLTGGTVRLPYGEFSTMDMLSEGEL